MINYNTQNYAVQLKILEVEIYGRNNLKRNLRKYNNLILYLLAKY